MSDESVPHAFHRCLNALIQAYLDKDGPQGQVAMLAALVAEAGRGCGMSHLPREHAIAAFTTAFDAGAKAVQS